MGTHRVDVTPKVTPISVTKKNNYISKSNFINQIKFLIFFQLFCGFNRMYLLPVKKYILVLCYMFSVLHTIGLTIFSYYDLPDHSFTTKAYKYGFINVNLIYIVFSFRKKNLLKYFRSMKIIDDQLCIFDNTNATSSRRKVVIMTLVVLFSNFLEHFLLFCVFYCRKSNKGGLGPSIIYSVVCNLELVFYSMLLWCIFTRVSVVKAQIEELYSITKIPEKDDSTVRSSIYKTHQRVSTLHRAFVKLHDCSLLLSSVFGIPILLSFVTSGFYSILLIKILVNFLQRHITMCHEILIVYILLRCVKLTLLLFLPCYYSSLTSTEVLAMRSTLHDAIRVKPMDKVERRLTKALYHAVKEYSFEYSLGGIVKLNMTLPLSYINLCTTYLIIFIQFSKFID